MKTYRVAQRSMYILLRAITGGDRQVYRLLENLSTDKIFKLQAVRSWGGAVKKIYILLGADFINCEF